MALSYTQSGLKFKVNIIKAPQINLNSTTSISVENVEIFVKRHKDAEKDDVYGKEKEWKWAKRAVSLARGKV